MEPASYSLEDVNRGLFKLPSLHARAEEQVIEAEYAVKMAKLNVNLAEAAAKLDYKEMNPKATATELNAHALEVAKPLLEILYQRERDLALLQVKAEELDNTFVAVRKSAEIIMRTQFQETHGTKTLTP